MLFDITHQDLLAVYAEDRILRADPAALDGFIPDGPIQDFLCTTGLPVGAFVMIPTILAPGLKCHSGLLSYDGIFTSDSPFGDIVAIGGFQDHYLYVHPVNGTLYAYHEMVGELEPVNADLSSFCATLLHCETLGAYTSSVIAYEERVRILAEIRSRVQPIDPMPFREDGHMWRSYFHDIEMGLY
jgi:hypothetical protein